MLESAVVKKIREGIKAEFGVTLHKTHGGPYSETGAADLYGTLPGGRAIFLEVKTPDKMASWDKRRQLQEIWLSRERDMGAVAAVVCSWPMVREVLLTLGYTPKFAYPQVDPLKAH